MADDIYTFPTAVFVDGKLDRSSIQPPPPAPTGPQWKGPLLDEDWHATQASFGGVDFWVQRGSDSERIRTGVYHRPYTRGANIEIMGQDQRQTSVGALLVLSQVKRLRALRDSRVARNYRDPTLGSYYAILTDVNVSWDATKLNFYQCELTFERQGIQQSVKVSVTPQSAYSAGEAKINDISDKIAELSDKPDFQADGPSGVSPSEQYQRQSEAAFGELNSAWGNFATQMKAEAESAPDPATGKNVLASAYSDLVSASESVVTAFDDIAAGSSHLLAETTALLYEFRDDFTDLTAIALEGVQSVANDPSDWAKILVTSEVDIATLVQRELGVVSESIVSAVMEANQPGFIQDPFMLPIGLEISIPVNLDDF